MNIIGIVAEYNPFHTGHGYQIAQSRQMLPGESAVVAVMSGNWVQQANCAIADKWTRARLALRKLLLADGNFSGYPPSNPSEEKKRR